MEERPSQLWSACGTEVCPDISKTIRRNACWPEIVGSSWIDLAMLPKELLGNYVKDTTHKIRQCNARACPQHFRNSCEN